MKVIAGLGNPGEKYSRNRHNVGFMVMDRLQQLTDNGQWIKSNKFEAEIVQTENYLLVKPQTFMNKSGLSIAKICHFYKVKYEDLYVIHDDLDITLGNYKIQFGKGPQIHNGLLSIEESLGTDQFWNVRVGVENRPVRGNRGVPGVVYSLQNFEGTEVSMITKVIQQIVNDLIMGIVAR